MFAYLQDKLKNLFNFAWLARVTTGRAPILKGLLPPPSAMVALLTLAAIISGGVWLWGGLVATASTMLPVYAMAVVGVAGFALLNFIFHLEITTFLLSSREMPEDARYVKAKVLKEVNGQLKKEKEVVDIMKMTTHICHEVNAYFRLNAQRLGIEPQDISVPRFCTYEDRAFKIITVEGHNASEAGLFFSNGILDSKMTHLKHRHLAALIEKELVKIYLRRGIGRTINSIAEDLSSTLLNLFSGNLFAKVLGVIAGPLSLPFLFVRSIQRSYEYEAVNHVIAMGRGMDLMDAIDFDVSPPLKSKPTTFEINAQKERTRRNPYVYHGPLQFIFKDIIEFFANVVDRNEYLIKDKNSARIWALLKICVREFGFYIREAMSPKPRATRVKDEMRIRLTAGEGENKIDGNTVTTPMLFKLYQKDIEINTNYDLQEELQGSIQRQKQAEIDYINSSAKTQEVKDALIDQVRGRYDEYDVVGRNRRFQYAKYAPNAMRPPKKTQLIADLRTQLAALQQQFQQIVQPPQQQAAQGAQVAPVLVHLVGAPGVAANQAEQPDPEHRADDNRAAPGN